MAYTETSLYPNSNLKRIHDSREFRIAVFGVDRSSKRAVLKWIRRWLDGVSSLPAKNVSLECTQHEQRPVYTLETYHSTKMMGTSGARIRLRFNNLNLTQESYEYYEKTRRSQLQQTNTNTEENKYDAHHYVDLKTKHIAESDAIIIAYNLQTTAETDEKYEIMQTYLKHIFKVKGYDATFDRVHQDNFCFFPIVLAGIETKSSSSFDRNTVLFAMDNQVDFESIDLSSYPPETFRRVADTVLDYYYYETLTAEHIEKLTSNAKRASSGCHIL